MDLSELDRILANFDARREQREADGEPVPLVEMPPKAAAALSPTPKASSYSHKTLHATLAPLVNSLPVRFFAGNDRLAQLVRKDHSRCSWRTRLWWWSVPRATSGAPLTVRRRGRKLPSPPAKSQRRHRACGPCSKSIAMRADQPAAAGSGHARSGRQGAHGRRLAYPLACRHDPALGREPQGAPRPKAATASAENRGSASPIRSFTGICGSSRMPDSPRALCIVSRPLLVQGISSSMGSLAVASHSVTSVFLFSFQSGESNHLLRSSDLRHSRAWIQFIPVQRACGGMVYRM
jgi:hypothetical protein